MMQIFYILNIYVEVIFMIWVVIGPSFNFSLHWYFITDSCNIVGIRFYVQVGDCWLGRVNMIWRQQQNTYIFVSALDFFVNMTSRISDNEISLFSHDSCIKCLYFKMRWFSVIVLNNLNIKFIIHGYDTGLKLGWSWWFTHK